MMSAPVGELAAGVFIPPAKTVVRPFFDVVHLRSLAQPLVPVKVARHFRRRKRAANISSVDSHGDFLNLAQQSAANHIHRTQKPISAAALLGSHKEHSIAVLPAGGTNQLVLFQCQRHGLLTEHMLAGLQRFHSNFHMPVIGRGDADNIDIRTIQNRSVVAADLCPTGPDLF